MNKKNISTPINEQFYLKRKALLCSVLGVFFIADFIYSCFIKSSVELEWLTFILFVAVIILMAIFLKSMSKIGRSVFWIGNFKDEYLNHIHNKGYQYSLSLVGLFLIAVTITSSIFPMPFATLPLHEFSKFTAGLMFVSYGFPILLLMRGDDE